MKTYMTVTAISMVSLVGLAIASLPFEGNRMANDRARDRVTQTQTQTQAHTEAGETGRVIYGGAL